MAKRKKAWEYTLPKPDAIIKKADVPQIIAQPFDTMKSRGRHPDGTRLSIDAGTMKKDGTNLLQGFNLVLLDFNLGGGGTAVIGTGIDNISTYCGALVGGTTNAITALPFNNSSEGGSSLLALSTPTGTANQYEILQGGIFIKSFHWLSINKNSGTPIFRKIPINNLITVIGTAYQGNLGYNPNLEYLLVLRSTTQIAQYSGISGTTITNEGDITLDTAVDSDKSFVYTSDDRIICIDTTNNIIRMFNSNGKTLKKAEYSITNTNITGVTIIDNRVYIVIGNTKATLGVTDVYATFDLIPSNMTI